MIELVYELPVISPYSRILKKYNISLIDEKTKCFFIFYIL